MTDKTICGKITKCVAKKRGDKRSYRIDLGGIDEERVQKEKGGFATKK